MLIDWFIDLFARHDEISDQYATDLVDIPLSDDQLAELWHEEGMMIDMVEGE